MSERHSIMQSSVAKDLPTLRYRVFLPENTPRARPLVIVHGSQRGAASMFHALLPACMATGRPLIAPTFAETDFMGYQTLNGGHGPLSAAQALQGAVAHASEAFDLSVGPFDLFGFSGGGQFAHRFAMVEPSSVAKLVVVAAGWYTYLDDAKPFPRGIAASALSGDRVIDADDFLALPTLVLVGDRDTERDESLRQSANLDRRQGPNRLARALKWIDHLEESARDRGLPSRAWFDVMPGVGHSFADAVGSGGLIERAMEFLDHPPNLINVATGKSEVELP